MNRPRSAIALIPRRPAANSGANRFPSVAAVAQWIEYWPPKPRVVGSIPASRTKFAVVRSGTQCGIRQLMSVCSLNAGINARSFNAGIPIAIVAVAYERRYLVMICDLCGESLRSHLSLIQGPGGAILR